MGDFSDAALVLLGHGSTVNADSAAPTHQHAEELRRRGGFAQVVTGFWKEHPAFSGVLRGVHAHEYSWFRCSSVRGTSPRR